MSELRQDLVSGDWIILAPERAARPNVKEKKHIRRPTPKSKCPFEDLEKSGNWPPIDAYPNRNNWRIVLIPNKYPALKHVAGCASLRIYGPHRLKTGAGDHELVVMRDHKTNFPFLKPLEAVKIFQMLQKRFKTLSRDSCNVYTSIFYNWGTLAGASLYHPHFQVLTLPIIPPDVEHSLRGSARYFKKYHRCVHCAMLKFDFEEKRRIIEENRHAVALAPYVSRSPYEVRIFPKRHLSRFEKMPAAELKGVVSVLQSSLRRIKKYLNDPDFNFFIHTAPLKDHHYNYYHWHIEIIPHISNLGGFELSTGVEIDVVDPADAARILRGRKVY